MVDACDVFDACDAGHACDAVAAVHSKGRVTNY